MEFDIVIIGSGPTGSICAITLKQLNPSLRICIVDRKKFPRDKACGDGLGPGVHKIIGDLGLISLFSKSEPIEKISISSPSGYELNSDLPKMGDIKPLGFVIPRMEFDNNLISEVRKLDITILEEHEITEFHDNGIFNSDVFLKNGLNLIILKTNASVRVITNRKPKL